MIIILIIFKCFIKARLPGHPSAAFQIFQHNPALAEEGDLELWVPHVSQHDCRYGFPHLILHALNFEGDEDMEILFITAISKADRFWFVFFP